MKISLIGMSGIGKTYWSNRLASFGFTHFSCDDLIEIKLQKELKKYGYSGIDGVAKWMGQPYDRQYAQASKKYLTFEKEVLDQLLEQIEKAPVTEKIVIDTTGSVIYMEKALLAKLRKLTTVIYLQTSEASLEDMFETYCTDPKPIVWGDLFNRKPGELNEEALMRCYPKLLQWRAQEYAKLAHISLDWHVLRDKTISATTFRNALKT